MDTLPITKQISGFEKVPALNNFNITKTNIVSRIKRKNIEKLKNIGDVSFCLEDSMKVKESYKALLIISREISEKFIYEIEAMSFPGGVPNETKDTIILAKKIFVSLKPALAEQFTIIRSDLDTVKTIDLSNKDYITWEWVITPLKVGVSNLILTLSRVEVSKGDLEKFIPTKIIPVKVYAERKSSGRQIVEFVESEWKFLVTTIFGGLGWILVYRRRKRKEIKDEKEDDGEE
jgi:hypothetical protein